MDIFFSQVHCPECGKEIRTDKNLYAHMKKHTGEYGFRCDICQEGFLQRSALDKHMKKHGAVSVAKFNPGIKVEAGFNY